MSGNSDFRRAWLGPQSIDCGPKQEMIGSASLRLTAELWGARAAVTQGNSLMNINSLQILGRVLHT